METLQYHQDVLTQEQYDRNLKWIESLRSGKYKQATGQLGNCEIGMCCLGVANYIFVFGLPSDRVFLDTSSAEALGLLNVEGGSFHYRSCSLARYNDQGYPFEEIAELIEASLTKVRIEG